MVPTALTNGPIKSSNCGHALAAWPIFVIVRLAQGLPKTAMTTHYERLQNWLKKCVSRLCTVCLSPISKNASKILGQ